LPGIFILSGVRTPIGKFGGALASLTAADMGMVAAKAAMERAGVEPTRVDETIFGCARQAGAGRMWRGRFRCGPACPKKFRRLR
jgi:acetyl-CoA C-acetyltransferase